MRYLLVLLLLFPFAGLAQLQLRGKVTNAITGIPIAHASVFLSNTSIGTKADTNGMFILHRLSNGQYDVVVSAVGYQAYRKTIMVNSDMELADIKMVPKTNSLNVVQIGADPNRNTKLRIFKEEFLGHSSLASQCKILNPEIIDLHFSNHENKLTGSTGDFLEIDNDALGYKLKYLVNSFVLDKEAGNVAYEGPVLFEEKNGNENDKARWDKNRRKVYNGSPKHFLREVLAGRPDSNFTVRECCIKDQSIAPKPNEADIGQLAYTYNQLQLADYVHPTDRRGVFAMGHDVDIEVFYYPPKRSLMGPTPRKLRHGGRVARISFLDSYLFFDSKGTILNPLGALFVNQWGMSRVAELLPEDYWPEKKI